MTHGIGQEQSNIHACDECEMLVLFKGLTKTRGNVSYRKFDILDAFIVRLNHPCMTSLI